MTARRNMAHAQNKESTTLTGTIKKFSRQRMGSFCNALVEGCGYTGWITLGISNNKGYRLPRIGDKIEVRGVMRDGRFLTVDHEIKD